MDMHKGIMPSVFNLKTAVGFRYPVDGSNLRPSAGFKTGNIFL